MGYHAQILNGALSVFEPLSGCEDTTTHVIIRVSGNAQKLGLDGRPLHRNG